MNLRKARIDDHWRTLFKRKYKISLETVSYSGNNFFDEFEAVFSNGLTCIVGKNGIGKSTFIRSLHNSLYSEASNRNVFKINTIKEGQINIQFTKNDISQKLSTELGEKFFSEQEESITSFLFDPCSTIPSLQEMLLGQDNFDELLDGYQEVNFTEIELKTINYLTGNNYEEVSLLVIEDEFVTFPSFPFFKVKSKSSTYDSRNMGLGELSLFYFYWLLNYVSKFDGYKLLLVEEPESFLPPVAQEKLANILAQAINQYGVSCILSTHSEHILKRVPRKNIMVFQKVNEKLKSRGAIDKLEYLKVIGLAAPKVGLLLFEDSTAILFFKAIIKYSKEFVPDSFYYHNSGSEGDVISDLKRMPGIIDDFRIIGILDGDCKARKITVPPAALYTYLPSNLSPEEVIIDFIKDTDKEVLSAYFNVDALIFNDALELTNGCDHHDYFEILSKSLAIPYIYIYSKLCEKWCESDDNRDSVKDFLIDFNSKIT